MKFLILHNRYSRTGGEEGVVAFQCRLLRERGHTVILYERSYDEIRGWKAGRLKSLFTALCNPQAVREVAELIEQERPDVAIVHNLFPVISPAVLPVLHRAGIPVLMTVHNYRLVCPIGIFYTYGHICERCGTSPVRELQCLLHRCEGSVAGSAAYALRGAWARWRKYYLGNVDRFLVMTQFQGRKLAQYGIPQDRMRLVPNCLEPESMPAPRGDSAGREYIAYAGRLSPEKGIGLLWETARLLPHIPFRVAGAPAAGVQLKDIPDNVELLGVLDPRQLADLYGGARMTVLTSRSYEGFSLTLLEAMFYGSPVVVPRLGSFPGIVEEGKLGLLYDPGSAASLADTVLQNWNDGPALSALAAAARHAVGTRYTAEAYYARLMDSLP